VGIDIKHLHIEYPGQLVFGDVSLTVSDNEIIAIKTQVLDGATSFLKGIAGFLKGVSGQVWVDDVDLLDSPSSEVYARIGYVYEDNGLLSIYNIQQNICLPLQFHTLLTSAEIAQEALYICDLLHIDHSLLALHPHHLNDVQTRMVNLARALITKPKVLLIDELEGGMPDEDLQETMARLKHRQKNFPMAVIITTASEIVMNLSDRVLKIENNDLIETFV
jgi:ABC-type sulfate/molybdate transport systems ATPase subunit